ncbi:MAG: putative toxin-antitoxin system toxin component, PIN family [Anaerolinea sp.]|nr:putative toxin-antitoxin system toxin component, PIN family [Anaerolinea sp.]
MLAPPSSRLLDATERGAVVMVVTPQIPSEVRRTLAGAKFRSRADWEIESHMQRLARILVVEEIHLERLEAAAVASRDPNDAHVVAAALAVHPDVVVTRDHDLLDLRQIGDCPVMHPIGLVRALGL